MGDKKQDNATAATVTGVETTSNTGTLGADVSVALTGEQAKIHQGQFEEVQREWATHIEIKKLRTDEGR
jgi:hypothetical protein